MPRPFPNLPRPIYFTVATILTFVASYLVYGMLNDKSQNIPWPIPFLAIGSGFLFPKKFFYLPMLSTLMGVFLLSPGPRTVFPSFWDWSAGDLGVERFLLIFFITIVPFILAGCWGHDGAFADNKKR